MNTSKFYSIFDPATVKDRLHIIGCGSIGSCVAELLARMGLENFVLYDFDDVEEKNIANQMFVKKHVGMRKVDALSEILSDINPDIKPKIEPDGYNGQRLSGYVFLCVDNIDVRRDLVEKNKYNSKIKAVFDGRTRLFDHQTYAADWSDPKQVQNLLNSMQFTQEEAASDTPTSACGEILSVAGTVRMNAAFTVENFMNFVRGFPICKMIYQPPAEDHFTFEIEAYQ